MKTATFKRIVYATIARLPDIDSELLKALMSEIEKSANDASDDMKFVVHMAISYDGGLHALYENVEDFEQNFSPYDGVITAVAWKLHSITDGLRLLLTHGDVVLDVNQSLFCVHIELKSRIICDKVNDSICQAIKNLFSSSKNATYIEWSDSERERQDNKDAEQNKYENKWNWRNFLLAIILAILAFVGSLLGSWWNPLTRDTPDNKPQTSAQHSNNEAQYNPDGV